MSAGLLGGLPGRLPAGPVGTGTVLLAPGTGPAVQLAVRTRHPVRPATAAAT